MRRLAAWLLPLMMTLSAAAESPVMKGQFDLYIDGVNKGREKFKIEVDKKRDTWYMSSDLTYKMPFPSTKRGYINVYIYPEYARSLAAALFSKYKYRIKIQDFSETDLVEADQSAREIVDQSQQVFDFTQQVDIQTEDVMRDHIDFGINAGGVRLSGNVLRFSATKINVERTKDEQLRGPLAVLDPMVACVYIPLLDQLKGEGPTWEFWFAIPQYLKYRPGRVEFMGVEPAVVAGKSYLLRHYDVKIQGSVFSSFWVDRAGRLVQVLTPKDGLLSVIANYEPQAYERAEPRVMRQVIQEKVPFLETRIAVPTGGVSLGATFTAPQGAGPFPAALLIQDIGSTDREGDLPGGLRSGTVRQLAYALAERGVASLRWDSHGVGESGGDAERSGFRERAEDASALAASLRSNPAVKPGSVFFLATGLGGWSAAYSAPKSTPAGLVLVGYPGKPIFRLWKEQVAVLSDPAGTQKGYAEIESLQEQAEAGAEWGQYRHGRRWLPAVRELAEVDPIALLKSVSTPALLAYPEKDLVVQPFHSDIVSSTLGSSQKSIPLPGVDHSLEKCDAEEGPTGIVDKAAVKVLADWILQRAASTP